MSECLRTVFIIFPNYTNDVAIIMRQSICLTPISLNCHMPLSIGNHFCDICFDLGGGGGVSEM